MRVHTFTFNPFSENTYIISDTTNECVIIDPGCYNAAERTLFINYIEQNGLKPVRLVNTHCHIDHILGNAYISEKYQLPLEAHEGEKPVLVAGQVSSQIYQIPYEQSPDISKFLVPGEQLVFGETKLDILFTPGHSPASVCLHHAETKQVIAGDVLFQGSVGRTDLPGGDMDTLLNSIKRELLVLDDATIVYPGHGPSTTVGEERRTNPFLQG